MTDDLVRLVTHDDHARGCEGRGYSCACGYDERVETAIRKAAARIEALEAENRAVRMMLADLHAATLTIATPQGSQLDEARDAAAAHFQNRSHPHAD